MTMPQQTGQFANMPPGMAPNVNWPNPIPFAMGPLGAAGAAAASGLAGRQVKDVGGAAVGWGAGTLEKGVRDVLGGLVHLLNPLLNTMFYVACAAFGVFMTVHGLSSIMGGGVDMAGVARLAVRAVK